MRISLGMGFAIVSMLGVACATTGDSTVRVQAARDLQCPERAIQLVQQGGSQNTEVYVASGCGRAVTIACTDRLRERDVTSETMSGDVPMRETQCRAQRPRTP